MSISALSDYLDSLPARGIPFCDCVVYRGHKPVFRRSAGFLDAEKTKPAGSGAAFWLYSATKPITCTAVMQLVEKGRLSLDAPVSDYLPEYGSLQVRHGNRTEPAKIPLTIRHLLSMQSGLNYDINVPSIRKKLEETNRKATTREIIGALASEPLDFEPGTHFQYSLSHDVLGAVVEAVSGQSFGEYLGEHIFTPLGMEHTGFTQTSWQKAHFSDQFEYRPETMTASPVSRANGYVLSPNYESGGAGLASTVDDYIRFLDALCNNGVSAEGYRLLSMESIEQMRENQLGEASLKDFALLNKKGYGYGLGVRTLMEKEHSGVKSPLGEFGWDGAAGVYVLADTENRLAIFYAQQVLNCGYAFDVIHPTIRDLVYSELL